MRVLQALTVSIVAVLSLSLSLSAAAYASSPNVHISEPFTMTVRVVDDSKGIYQVEVDNTNPLKYVNSYVWTPPGGMKITKILSAIGGTCTLTSAVNVVTCVGNAPPPSDIGTVGGGMVVTFTATGEQPTFVQTSYGGYYIHYGVIGSVQVHEGGFSDLPLCKSGQTSTKKDPCSKT